MEFCPSEEKLLIVGCKKNESWARKRLYELYAPAMLGICTRYVGDYENAKDVLHEGFIVVFTKINSFSENGSLGGWMRRIFVTKSLEFLRRNRMWRHADKIDYNEIVETVGADEISIVEKLTAEEILKCISELPMGYQLIFNMYAIEGYSHAEIAEILNIKEGTSRSQFAHARKILQHRIQELYTVSTKNKYE